MIRIVSRLFFLWDFFLRTRSFKNNTLGGTKQYIDDEKRDIELQKQYIDATASI